MEPLVAIALVNWNRKEDTLECIDSLRRLDYGNYRIVLVDNGSEDGSQECFRRIPDVQLIENGFNAGIVRANNIAIEKALAWEADYILLLNNDTVVERNMLRRLVEACEGGDQIGIVGPKMYYYSDPHTLWFAGGKIHFWRGDTSHIGLNEPDRGQYEEAREVDYITSCGMLAKRQVFETVGKINPSYFIYFDETDFCLKAKRKGWRIWMEPKAVLWHKVTMSVGSDSPRFWLHYTRSRLIFIRMNLSSLQKAVAYSYLAWVDCPKTIAHFIKRNRIRCITPFFKGTMQGLLTRIESVS